MTKTNYSEEYAILKELVTLQQVSTKEDKTKAIDRIIWSYICYIDTGHNMYIDDIIYAVEDCSHFINLPSGLNLLMCEYMDHLAEKSDIYSELDNL